MLPDLVQMSRVTIGAINSELAYQSNLPKIGRTDALDHGIEGQLVSLAVYTRRAQEAWTDNQNKEKALEVLRKVAAIAVRALEQHGCPRRKGY